MAERTWTCQRVTAGTRCGHINQRRHAICRGCGAKSRPAYKPPAHRRALNEYPYEWYVARFGEQCGICGAPPSQNRRLDRDHDHTGDGTPRGLLCHFCNRLLPQRATVGWLLAAAEYLRRAERLASGA